jgi:hypothetical protein
MKLYFQGGARVLASRLLKMFATAREDARPTDFSSEGTSEISQLRSGWCLAQRFFQVPQGRRTFSTVLSGRNFLRAFFQPLRSWLISGCRSAIRFAVAAIILFAAFGATAQTTNGLSDAEIQGRNLAQKISKQQPVENFTNIGVLKIRDSQGSQTYFPIKCEVIITPTNWENIYEIVATNNYLNGVRLPWLDVNSLKIIHPNNRPDEYYLHWQHNIALTSNEEEEFRKGELKSSATDGIVGGSFGDFHATRGDEKWFGTEFLHSFSQSDFWAVDLGLEFFHWPEQKILKHELRRSRACAVLESTNPNPSTNGYSRVVSWIDGETLGIVEAKAYDNRGKLLKEFYPKDFKKVDGQWQVGMMEMDNVQTGSRSRIEFDLKK